MVPFKLIFNYLFYLKCSLRRIKVKYQKQSQLQKQAEPLVKEIPKSGVVFFIVVLYFKLFCFL